MGFDDKEKGAAGDDTDTSRVHEESGDEGGGTLNRYKSESSIAATEDEEDDEDRKIELGPQCTLKEQLEKDKVLIFFVRKTYEFFYHFVSFYVCVGFCLRWFRMMRA